MIKQENFIRATNPALKSCLISTAISHRKALSVKSDRLNGQMVQRLRQVDMESDLGTDHNKQI